MGGRRAWLARDACAFRRLNFMPASKVQWVVVAIQAITLASPVARSACTQQPLPTKRLPE